MSDDGEEGCHNTRLTWKPWMETRIVYLIKDEQKRMHTDVQFRNKLNVQRLDMLITSFKEVNVILYQRWPEKEVGYTEV